VDGWEELKAHSGLLWPSRQNDKRRATPIYGKIFDTIYEGTLCGEWEALVTFQQMIVLCDADGMLDMTPQALAARTSIPLKILKKGIAVLEAADPFSRTPDQEGRRIERIDEHRPWGWHLVNHEKYKTMQDSDTVRAQTRERVRKHRDKKDVTHVTVGNAEKRHTDTDTDTDTDKRQKHAPPFSGAFLKFWTVWPRSPRKQARGECWERWLKHDLEQVSAEILAHVECMKLTNDWRKNDGEFIPAPLVYLRQQRWDGADSAPEPTGEVI
jgi:hypothetical protein